MTFNSAKEMLDTITWGIDLYSPSLELYVFVYNDETPSICVYRNMTKDFVDEYLKDNERDEYLGAYLGWANSGIFDGEECLDWCEEKYRLNDWMDITKEG